MQNKANLSKVGRLPLPTATIVSLKDLYTKGPMILVFFEGIGSEF
jgi:hypothetical protein